MEQLTISVSVAKGIALAAGKSAYGERDWKVTDEELSILTSAERLQLAEHGVSVSYRHRALPLRGPIADWPSIVEALRAEIEEALCAKEKEAQESEQRIEAALAAPNENWISESRVDGDKHFITVDGEITGSKSGTVHGRPHVLSSPREVYVRSAEEKDPRIIAKREWITANILPAKLLEWEANHTQWLALCAERDAETARHAELCRQYVIARVPDFARAARDGRDVTKQAIKALTEEIASWLTVAGLEVVKSYADRYQETPRSLAYERLDAVRAAVSDRAGDRPLIKAMEARIIRGDLRPERGESNWRTVVQVTAMLHNGESIEIEVCAEECCDGDNDE